MTRGIAEIAASIPWINPVVNVEDEQIWVSGMNSRPAVVAREIKDRLEAEGYDVGDIEDDDADRFGGLVIPIEECEELDDDAHEEVFGDAE